MAPAASGSAKLAKKQNLLDDSDSDSDNGGAEVGFKVNQEFAQRFEHNKKREERQRRTDYPRHYNTYDVY